jgi:hypothetical protein
MPSNEDFNPISGLPKEKLKPKAEPEKAVALDEISLDDGLNISDGKKSILPPLEEISVSSIMLDSIDTSELIKNDKQAAEKAISNQLKKDELYFDIGEKPIIDDLSNVYKPTYDKTKSLSDRPVLEKSEKDLIKERVQRELSSKPENFDQKKSLQMYNKLMEEQKIRLAKKGFLMVLLLIVMGLGSAAVTYFLLNWKEQIYFMYLALGAAFFSIILLIKAKPAKILATLFFAVYTIILIGPGLIKFAIDTELNSKSYFTIGYFVAAILLSGFVCFQLVTSETVEAYYSTHLLTDKK